MSGEKRDCRCPRANHQHGTYLGYSNDECRCPDCATAWADYTRRRRRQDAQLHWAGRSRFVTAIGVARRLQALAANGWSRIDIAHALGTGSNMVYYWQTERFHRVRQDTAERIAELYDQVWDKRPPGRYPVKIRNIARRHGWVPPMAWDDDEIDEPDAQPWQPSGSSSWEHRPHGTLAAARRHRRNGEPLCKRCRAAENRHEDEAA